MFDLRILKTIAFVYDAHEDRMAAAINAGTPEAWTGWMTRRLTLSLLAKSPEFLASTSSLVQRATPDARPVVARFQQEAAIAETAGAVSPTDAAAARSAGVTAVLLQAVTIQHRGDRYQIEWKPVTGDGAVGQLTGAELQRIMTMLTELVAKVGWSAAPAPPAAPATAAIAAPASRH